jgi:hypothetical protein
MATPRQQAHRLDGLPVCAASLMAMLDTQITLGTVFHCDTFGDGAQMRKMVTTQTPHKNRFFCSLTGHDGLLSQLFSKKWRHLTQK